MENSYRLPVASYGRMELAQIYFPHICGRAAWRKFKDCMAEYPELDPLRTISRRTFLPLEVECIFRNLGVPTPSAYYHTIRLPYRAIREPYFRLSGSYL